MTWRLAESLVVLRAECDAYAPNRGKWNDGDIGDAAHAARASRHNPYKGVVTALDITHDPAHGMDVHALVRRLTAGGRKPHPNCAYIISNRQKASAATGWRWVAYGGSNPHAGHAHFAVGVGSDSAPQPPYDDRTPWGVADIELEDDLNDKQDRLLKEIKVSLTAACNTDEIAIACAKGNIAEAERLHSEALAAARAKRAELGI